MPAYEHVLVSDLDHTMVQNEDLKHTHLLAFNHAWMGQVSGPSSLLVFSTGRSPTLFKQLWQETPLLTPDVLICSVGTEIFYHASSPLATLLAPTPAGPAPSPLRVPSLPRPHKLPAMSTPAHGVPPSSPPPCPIISSSPPAPCFLMDHAPALAPVAEGRGAMAAAAGCSSVPGGGQGAGDATGLGEQPEVGHAAGNQAPASFLFGEMDVGEAGVGGGPGSAGAGTSFPGSLTGWGGAMGGGGGQGEEGVKSGDDSGSFPLTALGLPGTSPPTSPRGTYLHAMRQGTSFIADPLWEAVLDQGWDAAAARDLVARHFPLLQPQRGSEQRPHKVSYTVDLEALPSGRSDAEALMRKLQTRLSGAGLAAKVVFSGGRDVDVISAHAGKGRALGFLLSRLREAGSPARLVQVNGDSGNDIELFTVPGVVGCVVANAHPELRTFAEAAITKSVAAGVPQTPSHTTTTLSVAASGDAGSGAVAPLTSTTSGGSGTSGGAGSDMRGPAPGGISPAASLSVDAASDHARIFLATLPCAGGILQAMEHFGFLTPGHAPAAAGATHEGTAAAGVSKPACVVGVPESLAGVAPYQACPQQDVAMSHAVPVATPGVPPALAGVAPAGEQGQVEAGAGTGADVGEAAAGAVTTAGMHMASAMREFVGLEPQGIPTELEPAVSNNLVPRAAPGVPADLAGLPEGHYGSVSMRDSAATTTPAGTPVLEAHPGVPAQLAGLSDAQVHSSEFHLTGGCEAYLHPPSHAAAPPSAVVPGACCGGGPGDTGGMQLHAGITEQAVRAHSGLAPAAAYTGGWCAASSPERGVREFAWRLGVALAEPLASGISLPTDLLGHSSIRLFVSNDCVIEVVPGCRRSGSSARRLPHASSGGLNSATHVLPGGRASTPTHMETQTAFRGSRLSVPSHAAIAPDTPPLSPVARHRTAPSATSLPASSGDLGMPGLTGPGASLTGSGMGPSVADASQGRVSDMEAKEIEEDLRPVGVADAQAGAEGGLAQSRAWIDGLEVTPRPLPPSLLVQALEAQAEAGGDEGDEVPCRQWDLSFRVHMLDPQGHRSLSTYSCQAVAELQSLPTPHGFLARALCVSGPLPPAAQALHINSTL